MRNVVAQASLLCLLAVLLAVASAMFHPDRPDWDGDAIKEGEVLLKTATQWQHILWVDARSQHDYEKQHVPSAILLNEDAWDVLLPELLNHWQPKVNVVVYCSSSGCRTSSDVAGRLRDEVGLESVYVLKGGWEAWRNAK